MTRRVSARLAAACLALTLSAACSHASVLPAPAGSGAQSTRPPRPPVLHAALAPFRLPTPIAREAVAGSGPVVTVAGGLLPGNGSTAAAYELDLRSGKAKTLPDMQVPVHDTAGARLGSRTIVIGGGNAAEQDVVQAWDGDAWSTIGRIPQARSDLTVVRVGKLVLVLGGYSGRTVAEPDILGSRDGRVWKSIGRLPVPVRYAASAVVGGRILLFGGERAGQMQTAIQQVDPSTGQASEIGKLNGPLGHASAIVLDDRVLIAGGRGNDTAAVDTMWWFNPRTRKLTPAGHLPMALADSAVATYRGHGYLLGGESPHNVDAVVSLSLD
ncbi:MAG: Kelch repeat-containing protein [Aeromicrobium sp.]